MNIDYRVEVLDTLEKLRVAQQLEEHVWDMPSTPVHQALTNAKNGGFTLGAWDGNRLIGFAYGFPGFKDGRVYFCSHMLGIHRDYRYRGLGALLKRKQRELALVKGYLLVTWTFDPLESVNGYLNLHKLRAIGAGYCENLYGGLDDGLNDGLPTDRLLVEWWIDSPYVSNPTDRFTSVPGAEEVRLFQVELNRAGFPKPSDPLTIPEFRNGEAVRLLLPLPLCFQEMKRADFSLALTWRMATRKLIRQLMGLGYVAVDQVHGDNPKLGHYVFIPKEQVMKAIHVERSDS